MGNLISHPGLRESRIFSGLGLCPRDTFCTLRCVDASKMHKKHGREIPPLSPPAEHQIEVDHREKHLLVAGIPTPSAKYSSIGIIRRNIWKNWNVPDQQPAYLIDVDFSWFFQECLTAGRYLYNFTFIFPLKQPPQAPNQVSSDGKRATWAGRPAAPAPFEVTADVSAMHWPSGVKIAVENHHV